MLKVGIDGCQNQVNGNWDKNKLIFLLSFVSTCRSQGRHTGLTVPSMNPKQLSRGEPS